jgi:hypothetical protein
LTPTKTMKKKTGGFILMVLTGLLFLTLFTYIAYGQVQEEEEDGIIYLSEPAPEVHRLATEALSQIIQNATAIVDEDLYYANTTVVSELQNAIDDPNDIRYLSVNIRDDGSIRFWIYDVSDRPCKSCPDPQTAYIETTHNYTPENGYEFSGQQIIAPNGTGVFP